MTVTLNTADTLYVHWRHIPRVQAKVKDNQYIYITYISITEQCMQRHVLMIPVDNVSQWTGTAGDNRSPQIIVIPVPSLPPLHSQSPIETFCAILFCKSIIGQTILTVDLLATHFNLHLV